MAGKLLVVIDLDLELDISQTYEDIDTTIKYLTDVKKSIEARVLGGEEIPGLKVVPGRKTREITDVGLKYLVSVLGEENVYEKKPIGITKLEKLLDEKEIAYLTANGLIEYKIGNDRVVVEK